MEKINKLFPLASAVYKQIQKGVCKMDDYKKNPLVDEFIDSEKKWKEEFTKLRLLVLESGLTEDLKWGVPCYTLNNKNVVLLHGFKEYCAILFVKGALLQDPDGVLIQQTENVQAARQLRFTGPKDIARLESVIKNYVQEAIKIEKAGLEVQLKKNEEIQIPQELQSKFDEMPSLKAAFYALTPGRQRAYVLYFAQPKQSATRTARVGKYMEQILGGKGLHD